MYVHKIFTGSYSTVRSVLTLVHTHITALDMYESIYVCVHMGSLLLSFLVKSNYVKPLMTPCDTQHNTQ